MRCVRWMWPLNTIESTSLCEFLKALLISSNNNIVRLLSCGLVCGDALAAKRKEDKAKKKMNVCTGS